MYDELNVSIIVEQEKARWVEDCLFDTDHSSLQHHSTVYKADHSDHQYSDYLSTVRCYPTGDGSVGSGVVAMAYMLTLAALAKTANIAAERTGSGLCACLAQQKTHTIFSFTAPHITTYISSTATFSIRSHLQ